MRQGKAVKHGISRYIFFFLGIVPFVITTVLSLQNIRFQHFSFLATSFLQGKLYFTQLVGHGFDAAVVNNTYYWPLGPFPAVVLMPFVGIASLFSLQFYEAYLHSIFFIGVFFLWYILAKKFRYSTRDALLWAFAFCFGSEMIDIAIHAMSWQFSQMLAVVLVVSALVVFVWNRNALLIGIFMGLALATRITAGIGIVFFLLECITDMSKKRNKKQDIVRMLLPFVFVGMVLLGYNAVRFGNMVESGYMLQKLGDERLIAARNTGIFHIAHLPGNLYHLLLAGPQPVLRDAVSGVLTFPFIRYDGWGVGLFITSPYCIYLFFLHYRDRIAKLLWLTVLVIAVPILLYYGIGYWQYGYRYALDFLPFLFFLLIRAYRLQFLELSFRLRCLIIGSILFNFYFLLFGA